MDKCYCLYQNLMHYVNRFIHRPLERAADCFFKHGRHRLYGALALAVICGVGFTVIGLFNRQRFGMLMTPPIHMFWVDSRIPFKPDWVWIYVLYYPFCFLPLLLKEVRDEPATFLRTMFVFGLQFAVSFSIFLLWPLRVTHGSVPMGINGELLGALYGFDLGFNSFPSLHLANITAVSLLYYRFSGKAHTMAVLLGAVLIAASTMLVKQHFVSDVVLGIVLGWATFAALFAWVPLRSATADA